MTDRQRTTVLTACACTLYCKSPIIGGVHRFACRSLEITRGPYAQHADALYVEFTLRGRRVRSCIDPLYGKNCFLLVLDGHRHPEPDGIWVDSGGRPASEETRVVVGRYRAFDRRWVTDFLEKHDDYLKAPTGRVLFRLNGPVHSFQAD